MSKHRNRTFKRNLTILIVETGPTDKLSITIITTLLSLPVVGLSLDFSGDDNCRCRYHWEWGWISMQNTATKYTQ